MKFVADFTRYMSSAENIKAMEWNITSVAEKDITDNKLQTNVTEFLAAFQGTRKWMFVCALQGLVGVYSF